MKGRFAARALIATLAATIAWCPVALAQERVPEPPLPSPTQRAAPEEDPEIAALEDQMVPTLTLPEFRVRVGGGIGIQTAGASNILGRVTQEVEWQPPALQFLLFGIGGAQAFGPAGMIWQVGGRIGGHAWFCEDSLVRCQGAITLQLGYVGGAGGEAFDFSADADLRFLFAKRFELFVRGGFLSVGIASFINVTAGVAIAF